MEKRFRSLRVIASILKILAWITLAIGVLGGIGILIAGLVGGLAGGQVALPGVSGSNLGLLGFFSGAVGGVIVGVVTLLSSLLYFLFLYATGDAINLALAIEENTRETAWYLKGGDTVRQ